MADSDVPMDPPGNQGQSSSSGTCKRKRTSLDNSDASTSALPRPKKARVISRKHPKKPKRPNDWHLRKGEVPNEAMKTKSALELHLRILWQLPDQTTVPPKVTMADKVPFNQRFSNEAQVRTSVTASLDQNSNTLQQARTRVSTFLGSLPTGSIISNNIKRVPEAHLLLIFQSVACLGLQQWAPDILSGDPESMYNLLHEHIALTTFEQVSSAFGYAHTGIDLSFIHNFALMRKLYRSFVYSYMYNIAKSEDKNPGSVAKGKQMTTVWKRRSTLANGRTEVFKSHGFNKRVVALSIETESHSDDELEGDPNSIESVYHIKEKEGRSGKVTRFFRMADLQRRQTAKGKRGHYKPERSRIDPPMPKPSALTVRPQQVPIDWFEPTYWNTVLTVRERLDYIQDGTYVALPKEEFCQTWAQCAAWKNLPLKEFMATYGNEVLKEYQMPTEEEIEQLERWENPESSGEEELEQEEVEQGLQDDDD
ncbi:hypothetical protein Hypma_010544 [Hypsizygus marmoreus]|uniref:Uncharacterized protein n=1 Tax=Hypsizygus marmoreus TaxID=39966 RepID=A0A369JJG3_HYPMA|nr:hypothetical protein Hypma_010544 [Hypsizygus marmoreus]